MKKLMFAMVAALSCAVVAQDTGNSRSPERRQFQRGSRDRGAMMADRAMRGRGGFGDIVGDPAVMAAMNPKVAEKIGLSKEQREQLKKLDIEGRAKVRELQAKTREAMELQAKLMKEEKVDEAAVMAAIDELFGCRKEMAKAQTKRLIAMKALLTPEQIAKAADAMKAFREEQRGKRAAGASAKAEGAAKPGVGEGGVMAEGAVPSAESAK